MGAFDTNQTIQHIDEIVDLRKEIEYYKMRSDLISQHLQSLIDCILGTTYYNEGCDAWSGEEFSIRDCKKVLNNPLVRWALKRAFKQNNPGFDYKPVK